MRVIGLPLCLIFGGWALSGCSGPAGDDAKLTEAAPQPTMEITNEQLAQALAGLSAADRAAIQAQKICPVTGEYLGATGTPAKVEVNGEFFFIGSEGDREAIEGSEAEYLARVKQRKGAG